LSGRGGRTGGKGEGRGRKRAGGKGRGEGKEKEGRGDGRGREKERGREGGKRRAPKLLFNQGPSQPCYATADESLLY